jgi:hypothetical protein
MNFDDQNRQSGFLVGRASSPSLKNRLEACSTNALPNLLVKTH